MAKKLAMDSKGQRKNAETMLQRTEQLASDLQKISRIFTQHGPDVKSASVKVGQAAGILEDVVMELQSEDANMSLASEGGDLPQATGRAVAAQRAVVQAAQAMKDWED